MEETEKTFDPGLRIVEANPTLRGAIFQLGGMGCFGVVVFFLFLGAFRWLAETVGEKFSWLAKLGSLLLFLLCLLLFLGAWLVMRDNVRNIRSARKLRKNGLRTKAVVVGREKVEHAEEDIFYVYYQFRPDFVVKFTDNPNDRHFYQLPVGSEVSVIYLENNPDVNTLVV